MVRIKRILIVITTNITPYDGLTTVAMNYYRELDPDVFHMDFASTNDIDRGILEELENNRSKYIKLPNRSSILYMVSLYKILKKYDIIHIHGNSATTTIELIPAVFARINKRIVHIHSTTCSHMIVHKLLKPIFKKCYTDAIACSKAAGDWIFADGRYTVLNNAIDLDQYRYDPQKRKRIREQYRLEDGSFVVGHVGRFGKEKNHTFLLDVFNELLKITSHAKLMLVGDGRLRKEIEEKSIRLGIKKNVIFCGQQNSSRDFFSAFDCFIFPSLWEGLGLALLEAQANGLDCIVSDRIPHEAGMTEGIQRFPLTEDAETWARLVANIEQTDRIAQSIHYCELMQKCGYDIKKNVSALEDFYLS